MLKNLLHFLVEVMGLIHHSFNRSTEVNYHFGQCFSHFFIILDPRQNPSVTTQEPPKFQQTISTPLSIDETYKQYLSSINQSLLDDELRKRFQRIALLDSELDKLHRMNFELSKNSERRSRRRSSTKDKDPLLKENEHLQAELMNYLKSLKTTMMINYPPYSLNNQTITRQQ